MIATEPAERGHTHDRVRRQNLSTILGLVHQSGASGLSRSELTVVTGLNRSTIAALVAELSSLELVIESDPETTTGVGRPSPVVRTSARMLAIAVNPEIDVIRVGVVSLGGRVIASARRQTPNGCSARRAVELTTELVAEVWADFAADHIAVGVGVAVPGLVRTADGVVRLAPHLEWSEAPFSAMLSDALRLRVDAANDASLGALAERTFGAGRGAAELVYFNGGASGIGGGIVTRGSPLGGAAGYAGELGHTLVNSAGVLCHCGAIGCLETEVTRGPLLRLVGLSDASSDDLEATLAASTSDAVGAEVHRQLGYLGIALRNIANILNPQRIVLGGFLGAIYAVDPEYLERCVAVPGLAATTESLVITRSELGPDILMLGAAELSFGTLLNDPAGWNLTPYIRR